MIFYLLTVSHLARARSSSNLANSLLSWIVTRSFQMSRAARPRNKMAPATDSSTTKMSGPLGQSGKREKKKGVEWARADKTESKHRRDDLSRHIFLFVFQSMPECESSDILMIVVSHCSVWKNMQLDLSRPQIHLSSAWSGKTEECDLFLRLKHERTDPQRVYYIYCFLSCDVRGVT